MSRSPFGPAADGFTCPQCGTTSHHPDDLRFQYCGRCHEYVGDPLEITPASTDDPASVPGAIVGPGEAFDRNSVIVDARHALLLETIDVARVEARGRQRSTGKAGVISTYMIELAGTRAQEPESGTKLVIDPANHGVLVLMQSPDGVAGMIVETMALLARHDKVLHDVVHERITERLTELDQADSMAEFVGRQKTGSGARIADPGAALIPDALWVTLVTEDPEAVAPPVAYQFEGRVNRSSTRASTVVLASSNRAAELVARLMHAGHDDTEVVEAMRKRVEELRANGTYPSVGVGAGPTGGGDEEGSSDD